jgi:hypothetical protein
MFRSAPHLVRAFVLGLLIAGGLSLTPLAGYSDTHTANDAAHQAIETNGAMAYEYVGTFGPYTEAVASAKADAWTKAGYITYVYRTPGAFHWKYWVRVNK